MMGSLRFGTRETAQAGGSRASTRSSNFEKPSAFEMQTTPMALHRVSESLSAYIVNRMTGVPGIAFFKTVAASTPFKRGMARSRSIKLGRNDFAFSIASRPSTASRTLSSVCLPSSNIRTDNRILALSSAMRTVLDTN